MRNEVLRRRIRSMRMSAARKFDAQSTGEGN
jgi:hypothetical protein